MKRLLITSIFIMTGLLLTAALSNADSAEQQDLSLPGVPESDAISDRPEDQVDEQGPVMVTEAEAPEESVLETSFIAEYDGEGAPGTKKGKKYHICEDGFVEEILEQEDRSDWLFGKIHPKLLTEGDVPQAVIIEMKSKPLRVLRQQIESPKKGVIQDLKAQIRELTDSGDKGSHKFTESEKQAVAAMKMTQSQKQQLKQLHQQLDMEMDLNRKQAFEAAVEQGRPVREQVRAMVERLNGQVTGGSAVMNCVGAVVPAEAIPDLAQSDSVERIVPDYPIVFDLDESACTLGADDFWNAGYDGGAYDAAVIDAGIRETHHYLRYKDPVNQTNERPI